MRYFIALVAVVACAGSPASGPPRTNDNPDGGSGSSNPGSDAGSGSQGGDAGSGTVSGVGPYFEHPMFFNTDVSAVAKSASSDSIIAALKSEGGWGNGGVMQIDFSIDVLTADASTPMRSFTPTSDFYTPDCDKVDVPVPPGGDVEGETGYACTGDGDCHLLVNDTANHTLYEMWRANITSAGFMGGCLAAWDTSKIYDDTLRGDQCTSADAAGFPISPMLFTADEVAAGHIDHAIRFILPNDRPKVGYTRPATHGTTTTGDSGAPGYGVHLRLRADYPIDSLPSAGAKVVAQAMQKYGMYQADGGQIALTAQVDTHTTAKWSGLLDSHDLAALKITDFEVIDHGSLIPLTGDCQR